MRITIATPLFPPDIAEPAPYVKELASRLKTNNEVTVLMYGHLPERVSGVTYVCIDKRAPLLIRLYRYSRAVLETARKSDALYALNGPSVELPLLILSFFKRVPVVFVMGDGRAHARALRHGHLRTLEQLVKNRSRVIQDNLPLNKPEALPFGPKPTEALSLYEKSWDVHLQALQTHTDHA